MFTLALVNLIRRRHSSGNLNVLNASELDLTEAAIGTFLGIGLFSSRKRWDRKWLFLVRKCAFQLHTHCVIDFIGVYLYSIEAEML